jgi:uncharacterized repeat protein (TIGR01451 family)
MNKKSFFTILILLVAQCCLLAQVVDIPDANFKNALVNGLCVDTDGNFAMDSDADFNNDGEIQVSEALLVRGMDIRNNAIQSLQGIEYFSQLKRLDCRGNQLASLNLQGLNFLQSLICNNNQLTSLSLQNLGDLQSIDCDFNQLTSINLQGLSNLKILRCSNNQLTSLDLQGLSNLENLICTYNQLTSLVVQGLSNLKYLTLSGNQLVDLNVQGLINLSYLLCSNNQLTTLQVSGLSHLGTLHCSNNQLTLLDVQGLTSLRDLTCDGNQLTNLDLHEVKGLITLSCSGNPLTTLDVQVLNNLETLICSANKLEVLDVKTLSNLITLFCASNPLTTLDLQGLSNLRHVSCLYNPFLTSLNVQGLGNLIDLDCSNNQLTNLDLSGLSNLTTLYCYQNQLTTLNVNHLSNLNVLQCSENQLTSLFVKNDKIEFFLEFFNNPNLSYICCDPAQITSVYNQTLQYGQTCIVNTACSYVNTYLNGTILLDQNLNCQKDTQEIGLEKRIVKAEKDGQEPLFSIANNQGQYQMDLDTGLYKITTYLFNNYSVPCEDSIWVNLPQVNDSATVDLLLQPVISCPLMEVNIASNFIRRCFDNQYIIQYCNAGTASAPNGQVTINLSDDVAFVSSTIPGSNVGGNNWQFSVGEVQPDDCGSFSLVFHVICDSTVLGQSICATAHITPDSICTPASTSWSGAQVMVDGFCEGDSVRFTIQNIGFGDMTEEQEYIVIEDDVILFQSPFILDALESIVFRVPANGSTWLLQAGQEPTFPFVSMPFASVEGCGLNLGGLFSLGFVTQFSEQDGNPFFSKECREVIGSYDPNEKLAQPKGVYDKHFIYPGTDIEYQINFQNTGTDTAFTVVIRDTLSYGLDVATFRAGISSHTYQVDVSGYGVLKFTFDNILLPDSNINEAASHGFVRFRITPKDTLQLGSRVENRAGIYFDFNPPIITNTVFHTVDTGFMERKMVAVHGLPDAENGRIFPNPVRAGGYLFFEDMSAAHRIVLMDPYGKVVLQANGSHKIRIPDGLAGGMYFLEWRGGSGGRFWGKLVVLE